LPCGVMVTQQILDLHFYVQVVARQRINIPLKVNYDGKKVNFTPLLQVLQLKDALLLAVEPLRKKVKVDPTIVAAVMFNILGFYVQLLKDSEQNDFVSIVKKEIQDMIDNGFDKFDRGIKIK
jgi:hypothetical protein